VGQSPPLPTTCGYLSSEQPLTDNAEDGRERTAEELVYLDKVQEQLAGPLTERQLAILRRWWHGGYASDQ
jgi:hypothetical protein